MDRRAVLFNPDHPSARLALKEMSVRAQALHTAFATIETMADALTLIEDPVVICGRIR
jgi:hypothetical protein